MPDLHLTLPQIVTTLIALTVAVTRLFNAAKPIWNRVPEPYYSLIPAAIVVLPDLAQRLAGVQTGTDLVIELVTAVSLMVPGARSATHKEALSGIVDRSKTLLVCLFVAATVGSVQGCASGTPSLNWPSLLRCAEPASHDVLDAVSGILMQEGDPAKVLEELARQLGADGPGVVACAISSFIGGGSDTLKLEPAHAGAVARGRAFLNARGIHSGS